MVAALIEIKRAGDCYSVWIGSGIEVRGFQSVEDAGAWIIEWLARMLEGLTDAARKTALAGAALLEVERKQ